MHTQSGRLSVVMSLQTSAFGAWLDVTIDNLSRGVLWAWALPGPYAAFPIAVEFLTFVATHKVEYSPMKPLIMCCCKFTLTTPLGFGGCCASSSKDVGS